MLADKPHFLSESDLSKMGRLRWRLNGRGWWMGNGDEVQRAARVMSFYITQHERLVRVPDISDNYKTMNASHPRSYVWYATVSQPLFITAK